MREALLLRSALHELATYDVRTSLAILPTLRELGTRKHPSAGS